MSPRMLVDVSAESMVRRWKSVTACELEPRDKFLLQEGRKISVHDSGYGGMTEISEARELFAPFLKGVHPWPKTT